MSVVSSPDDQKKSCRNWPQSFWQNLSGQFREIRKLHKNRLLLRHFSCKYAHGQYIHTHTRTYSHTHEHIHTHTNIFTHTHTRTYSQTHTNIFTHTQTYSHTHSRKLDQLKGLCSGILDRFLFLYTTIAIKLFTISHIYSFINNYLRNETDIVCWN